MTSGQRDPPSPDASARTVEVVPLRLDVAPTPRTPAPTDWPEPYWGVVAAHDGNAEPDAWWCVEPGGIALFETLDLAMRVVERLTADALWDAGSAPQWDARGVPEALLDALSADPSVRLFVAVRLAGEGAIAIQEWSTNP